MFVKLTKSGRGQIIISPTACWTSRGRCESPFNSDLMFLWKQLNQLFEDFHVELGSISSLDQGHKLLIGTLGVTEQKKRRASIFYSKLVKVREAFLLAGRFTI